MLENNQTNYMVIVQQDFGYNKKDPNEVFNGTLLNSLEVSICLLLCTLTSDRE